MVTNSSTNNCISSTDEGSNSKVEERLPPVTARWNPTTEQIAILETLYRQGMRTPTAQQIQQITSQLRLYGHIQGKNVFYWFQNHKARERQKEKQDKVLYINPFIPVTMPHAGPPGTCPNILPSPYHGPQASSINAFPTPHTPAFMPEGHVTGCNSITKTENSWALNNTAGETSARFFTDGQYSAPEVSNTYTEGNPGAMNLSNHNQNMELATDELETLELFPLHPGI